MSSTLLNIETKDYSLLDNSQGDAPGDGITSALQDVSTTSISQLWFLRLSMFAISSTLIRGGLCDCMLNKVHTNWLFLALHQWTWVYSVVILWGWKTVSTSVQPRGACCRSKYKTSVLSWLVKQAPLLTVKTESQMSVDDVLNKEFI